MDRHTHLVITEWEGFKFLRKLGLTPSFEGDDSAEIQSECYSYQKVHDEFHVTRLQRATKSRALDLFKKLANNKIYV